MQSGHGSIYYLMINLLVFNFLTCVKEPLSVMVESINGINSIEKY